MDDDWSFVFVLFVLVCEVKSDGELEIELDRGAVESSSQCVKGGDVNFRTVKRAVARFSSHSFPLAFNALSNAVSALFRVSSSPK